MLKQSQLESSQLWKDLENAQINIMDLQRALDEALESNDVDNSAYTGKPKRQAVDDVRTSLHKFASLFNLWLLENVKFYQQECPENFPDYIGNINICYEDNVSEGLGMLAELYSTFPEDEASLIAMADKPFRDMVCVWDYTFTSIFEI